MLTFSYRTSTFDNIHIDLFSPPPPLKWQNIKTAAATELVEWRFWCWSVALLLTHEWREGMQWCGGSVTNGTYDPTTSVATPGAFKWTMCVSSTASWDWDYSSAVLYLWTVLSIIDTPLSANNPMSPTGCTRSASAASTQLMSIHTKINPHHWTTDSVFIITCPCLHKMCWLLLNKYIL